MMPFEDVQIQLVDLPPIAREHMDPWMPNVVRGADAALLVVDPDLDRAARGRRGGARAARRRARPARRRATGGRATPATPRSPTLMVITKADRAREEDLEVLEELYGVQYPLVRVSASPPTPGSRRSRWRCGATSSWSASTPSRPASRPTAALRSCCPSGTTVVDLAERIHREIAEKLHFARVWGGKLDGQRVARDFELRDRDVVELHV